MRDNGGFDPNIVGSNLAYNLKMETPESGGLDGNDERNRGVKKCFFSGCFGLFGEKTGITIFF